MIISDDNNIMTSNNYTTINYITNKININIINNYTSN